MQEEEELMMGADDKDIRRIKTAWKAAMSGPPALEASIGAVSKCKIPAINLPIPVAKIEKAFKPIEKKFSQIQVKSVKATSAAAKSFQKEFKAADANKNEPPALLGRKSSLSAANLQLLLKIDELLDSLSEVARANIPVQNDLNKLQRDLKKAQKEAAKERDKKKPVQLTVLGQAVEVKAGDVPKVIAQATKLGTEMKAFDSALADLMSAWARDRQALVVYGNKVNGFSPKKILG